MYRFEYSRVLGRHVRKDDWKDLGTPTWTLLKQALKEKKRTQALDLFDNMFREHGCLDVADRLNKCLSYIASHHGEYHVEKALRWWRTNLINAGDNVGSLSLEELIQYQTEELRFGFTGPGSRGSFIVDDEKDRFVINLDPCQVGRMRRIKKINPDFELGTTKSAHDWSWGKKDVPYLCTRCRLWWEMMPVEEGGVPVRMHEFPDNPDDPCRIIYYKDRKKIPEAFVK
ncbi:MAG: hypothetical protein HKM93_02360 [Desulfobacteraceae bacterium]|nr:hypothetical protein [Desulfobacteraceae bacterium]